MHKLIITAHPSSKGFTHQIAQTYSKASIEAGHTVEVLDLYKAPRQDFLVFEDKDDVRPDQIELRNQNQAKITAADELIFVHPLWWGTTPAILKNWLDINFSSGFAFAHKDGKVIKMLTGKTARVFITCDAPAFIYVLLANPFKSIWSMVTFGYVGIKCLSFDVLGNKRKQSPEKLAKFLEKVSQIAKD